MPNLTRKCYELSTQGTQFLSSGDFNIKHASDVLNEFKPSETQKDVSTFLNEKIGSSSTYTKKNQLIQSVQRVVTYLDNVNNPKDEKKVIVAQIFAAMECAEGFMVRIQNVLLGLKTPKTMDDFLQRRRISVVETAYREKKSGDKVHKHNSYFSAAHREFGVPLIHDTDTYKSDLTSNEMASLRETFNKRYTALSILDGFCDDIRGALTHCNYVGRIDLTKETEKTHQYGYTIGEFNIYLDLFKTLFGDPALDHELRNYYLVMDDNDAVIDINWKAVQKKVYKKLEGEYLTFEPKEKSLFDKLYGFSDEALVEGDKVLINSLSFIDYPGLIEHIPLVLKAEIKSYLFDEAKYESMTIDELIHHLEQYPKFFSNASPQERKVIVIKQQDFARRWIDANGNRGALLDALLPFIARKDLLPNKIRMVLYSLDTEDDLFSMMKDTETPEELCLWIARNCPKILIPCLKQLNIQPEWATPNSTQPNSPSLAVKILLEIAHYNLQDFNLMYSYLKTEKGILSPHLFFDAAKHDSDAFQNLVRCSNEIIDDEEYLSLLFPESSPSNFFKCDLMRDYRKATELEKYLLEGLTKRSLGCQKDVWDRVFNDAFMAESLFPFKHNPRSLDAFFEVLENHTNKNKIWKILCEGNYAHCNALQASIINQKPDAVKKLLEEVAKASEEINPELKKALVSIYTREENLLLLTIRVMPQLLPEVLQALDAYDPDWRNGSEVKKWLYHGARYSPQSLPFIVNELKKGQKLFYSDGWTSPYGFDDNVLCMVAQGRSNLTGFLVLLDQLQSQSEAIQTTVFNKKDHWTNKTALEIGKNNGWESQIFKHMQQYSLNFQVNILKSMGSFNFISKNKIISRAIDALDESENHPIERLLKQQLKTMHVFAFDKQVMVLDAIREIKQKNPEESEKNLLEAINKPDSALSKALSLQRLTSFFSSSKDSRSLKEAKKFAKKTEVRDESDSSEQMDFDMFEP